MGEHLILITVKIELPQQNYLNFPNVKADDIFSNLTKSWIYVPVGVIHFASAILQKKTKIIIELYDPLEIMKKFVLLTFKMQFKS